MVRPNPKTCPPTSAGPHCVDTKLDFLVRELKRFDVYSCWTLNGLGRMSETWMDGPFQV